MTPDRWQRVKAIFDRAVECAPAERSEFLLKNSAGDPDLLKEVESLLACYHSPGTLLENPAARIGGLAAAALYDAAGTQGLADPHALLPDRYEVLGELGRGGMGVVYKARDRETGEVLALKVLKPEIAADQAILERFKNELLLAHRITHPNVARLYEFHRTGATPFLSMEYVEGESLRQLLRRVGRLDIDTGLGLACQLARGLAQAHRQSIAHRDLKPENIMIAAGGELKVLDFGISRSYDAGATATGTVIGTPAYMAPEQVAAQPADHRTDIYAMGVILFEMFTGVQPFKADTPVALAVKQMQERPPLPRALAPELPANVEQTILKCLEKDPADRFQSVEDLLRALEGAAPAPAVRARHGLSSRWRVMAAGAAALALVLALSAALWPALGTRSRSLQQKPSVAVLPFVDRSPEQNQEHFSDGIAEQLLNSLAKIEGLRVAGRTSSFQFKGTTEDSRSIGKKLNVTAILEGSLNVIGRQVRVNVQLINTADGFNLWSNSYDREMSDIFELQDSIARAVTEALKVKLLPAGKSASSTRRPHPDAYIADLQGRFFLGRNDKESLKLAVSYFEQAIKADPGYAPSWVGLAAAHVEQSNAAYLPAEKGFQRAGKEIDTALSLDPNLAEAYATLGRIRMLHDWDWAGADSAYQRALVLQPGKSNSISQRGNLARIQGRFDEAIALARQAIQIDPLVPAAYHNAGLTLYYAGRYAEAVVDFKKALELAPDREKTHSMLAAVYLVTSKPGDALAEARLEKNAALQLWAMTLAWHRLGQKKDSDAGLADLIARFGSDAPFLIAEIYAYRGELDQAFYWLDRAYAEQDSGITLLRVNPLLTLLKHDSRYVALLKKLRLPL